MYYVYKNGKCATNETVGGIKFNKNGYASNLTQARCKLAARNFIACHSNANASNYEKFRSCFYYIMAYTNFVGYMDPTPQEFKTKDWVYKYSLQMFENGLTGNCYGIASSVAAIAKELGYEPYVITIPDGHSFVMINGLYYDNMYGTLFGAATRPAYTIEHNFKKRSMENEENKEIPCSCALYASYADTVGCCSRNSDSTGSRTADC